MRRLLLILLLLVPGIAVSSAFLTTTATHASPAAAKHCTKKTKKVKGHRVTVKTCHKTPIKRPKLPTATSTPTNTATSTPTSTVTSTPTSTPSPTPTSTPHPPSIVTIPIQAQLVQGYSVEFMVCGLPQGVVASFTPNPSSSVQDFSSPLRAGATSQLAISVPFGTVPNTYALAITTYYKTGSGTPVPLPAGGAFVQPNALVLQVAADGGAAIIVPSAATVATSGTCSSLDASYKPMPTATPSPADVAVSVSISNQFPPVNSPVTVTAKLTVRGVPQYGALMTTKWYFPFSLGVCDGVTDGTGQASCGFTNARTLPNYPVQVQVSFTVNGQTYYGYAIYYM